MPAEYPSLAEVAEAVVGCKSYVPKGTRNLWAQCLVAAMAAVTEHNDEKAWTELFMLPSAVLRSGSRGGTSHRRRAEAETKRLCRDWLDGHRVSLWRRAVAAGTRRSSQSSASEAKKQQRAVTLLKEELYGKAASALVNEPPAAVNDTVRQEMRAKHPAARVDDSRRMGALREVSSAAALSLGPEVIQQVIKAFPRGSAGGPSGLKPQHLKDALVPGMADEVVRHTTALVNLLVKGEACAAAQPFLCGAALAALPKSSGGLRPVAVGETLRRLVAKAAVVHYRDDFKQHLEPIQMGVGTRFGCEAIVHTVRQWLARNALCVDKCIVKIDLSNAFNCVDRSAVLLAVRAVAPDLAPWCDFCYKSPSRLSLGTDVLFSTRGLQQGDPLGPALFSLAVHDAILRARARASGEYVDQLDFTVFYLDDGVVAGTGPAVELFCQALATELADIGLTMSLPKCQLIPAAGDSCTIPRSMFSEFEWVSDGDFEILGAPVGSAEYCTAHTRARGRKAKSLLAAVGQLPHSQGGLLLLRQCASFCKLVYSSRTTPPALHAPALAEFDLPSP